MIKQICSQRLVYDILDMHEHRNVGIKDL